MEGAGALLLSRARRTAPAGGSPEPFTARHERPSVHGRGCSPVCSERQGGSLPRSAAATGPAGHQPGWLSVLGASCPHSLIPATTPGRGEDAPESWPGSLLLLSLVTPVRAAARSWAMTAATAAAIRRLRTDVTPDGRSALYQVLRASRQVGDERPRRMTTPDAGAVCLLGVGPWRPRALYRRQDRRRSSEGRWPGARLPWRPGGCHQLWRPGRFSGWPGPGYGLGECEPRGRNRCGSA